MPTEQVWYQIICLYKQYLRHTHGGPRVLHKQHPRVTTARKQLSQPNNLLVRPLER